MPPSLSPSDLVTVPWKPSLCLSSPEDKGHTLHRNICVAHKLASPPPPAPTCFSHSPFHLLMLCTHPSIGGRLDRAGADWVVTIRRVGQGPPGGKSRDAKCPWHMGRGRMQSGEILWIVPTKLKYILPKSTCLKKVIHLLNSAHI